MEIVLYTLFERRMFMRLVKYAKTGNIVSGAAFLALGFILMLFPEFSLVTLSKAAGAVLFISGAVRIIGYFSKDLYSLAFQFDLALGILSVLFGAVLFLRPTWLASTVPFLLGAFALINGLFAVQNSLDSKKFGMKYWWVLFTFSVLLSVLGFSLIVNPFRSAAAIARIIGMTLLFVGAEKIFVSVYTIVTKKNIKNSKDEKDTFIDLNNFKDYKEGTD